MQTIDWSDAVIKSRETRPLRLKQACVNSVTKDKFYSYIIQVITREPWKV